MHVSNYAVLVTDVPDLLADDDGDDREDRQPWCCMLAQCCV